MTTNATLIHDAPGAITTIAMLRSYGPKLVNHSLVLMQDSYADEGTFTPAQSISLSGTSLASLRAYLNTLPTE